MIPVLVNLLGSIALLLWGLRMVRTGIVRAFGGDLKRVMRKSLSHPLASFASGLGITLFLQSSTATLMIAGSFAERGALATASALAVALGADVGTSLVAQLLSLKLAWLSPLFLFVGVAAFMYGDATKLRDMGRAIVGLGLMLLALHLIVNATEPLRHSQFLRMILPALNSEPILGLVLGGLLTWLAHSSLAIVILVMSLVGTQVITPDMALVLILGVNIGGAMPAVVTTWNSAAAARRPCLGNLAFRLIGGLFLLPFIGPSINMLASISTDPAQTVVNFHTFFNIGLAVIFLPIIPIAAKIAERFLPDIPTEKDIEIRPRYLNPGLLDTPSHALAAAARETFRMGDVVEGMLCDTMAVFENNDRKLLTQVSRQDDVVDNLHEAIKLYLTDVTMKSLPETEGRRCLEIIAFTTNLEHVGDIIDKNLMGLAAKKIKNSLKFSQEGLLDIKNLHGEVLDALRLALAVFMNSDLSSARQLLQHKEYLRERERRAAEAHFQRLRERRFESIETSSLHLDILRDLIRINSHLTSIAYPILEQAGELRPSRLQTA